MDKDLIIIHYPPGGFGHYLLSLISTSFDEVFCPDYTNYKLSSTGDSHNFPQHYKKWYNYSNNWELTSYYNFNNKKSILLVDAGINNDHIDPIVEMFPNAVIIRPIIDELGRSIILQTCRYKAEKSNFQFSNKHPCEIREQYTLIYHNADKDKDFYLNKFQPVNDCVNIPISELYLNFDKTLSKLEEVIGSYNKDIANQNYEKMLSMNYRYFKACELISLYEQGKDINFKNYTSLHDQGFFNYWIEKKFNIKEIPPFDYKNWFSDIDHVNQTIKDLTCQNQT